MDLTQDRCRMPSYQSINFFSQEGAAVSEELGLIALPKSDGIVQLAGIREGSSVLPVRCELEVRHIEEQQSSATASIAAVLQTCWGTSRINPTILALAFPQAVVLWSISSSKGRPGGKTDIKKCLASIIHPTRKPRAIGWHPTSPSSILTISTVAELTLYNTSQVTSPVPLYSIPSPTGATIESWAWDRNGQTLVTASSRQIHLLKWTKDTAIESGPPSMLQMDSSCSRGANAIAAGEEGGSSSGLGKMRSIVALGSSSFVVTTEQGTWLTPHGGGSSGLSGLMGSRSGGSQSVPILNTTLAELRRSRKQGLASVESRLGAVGEDKEEGDRIGSGGGGIIDLVGKLGTANSHASPLEALLGGLSLDGSGGRNGGGTRNGSGSSSSIAAAKLLTLKLSSASSSSSSSKEQEADKGGGRIISSEITSSIALDTILIPGLLASEYNPQDDSTHIVVGSEFCGTLLCFKCLSSHRAEPDQAQQGKGASSNGKQQQIQEVAKITLPAQFHPRGLAIHKGTLLCFAVKQEGDGKGPLIRTMNTTSVYATRLLMFHPSWQQRRQQEEGGRGEKEERVVNTANGLNADLAAMLDGENVESVLDDVIMHQRGPIELTAMLGSPLNNHHHHHQRPSSSPFFSPNRGRIRNHDTAGGGVLAFLKDFRKEMREKLDTIEEVVRENSRRISALERRLSLAHRSTDK